MSRLIKSFSNAIAGILQCLKEEKNMRIHAAVTLIVIIAGFFWGLDRFEWSLIIIAIAMVWSAEVINTAVEKIVDLITPGYHPLARSAKNMAAGAVLLTTINAIIIGLIIFLPLILKQIFRG
jgi:diacylglycerol kinase